MEYGERVKELRSSQQLSARQLALKSKLDPSQISKIESGVSKPSLDALERICDTINISLADFFNVQKNNESPQLSPSMQKLVQASEKLSDEELEHLTRFIELKNDNNK